MITRRWTLTITSTFLSFSLSALDFNFGGTIQIWSIYGWIRAILDCESKQIEADREYGWKCKNIILEPDFSELGDV